MFDSWKRILGIKPATGNKHPLTLLFDQWLENIARGPRRVLDHNFKELGGAVRKAEELPGGLRAVNGPDHRGWLPVSLPAAPTARRGSGDDALEAFLRDGAVEPPSR
jgi:hypothetical protein